MALKIMTSPITWANARAAINEMNIQLYLDAGLVSEVAYTPTTDVTALTDDVVWYENNFYIPTGVTTFTFTDGTTDMVATFDMTWSFDVAAAGTETELAYTQVTTVSDISNDVTYNGTHFIIPEAVTTFTFTDDQNTYEATLTGETWDIEMTSLYLFSTDGTGNGENQSWSIRLPEGNTVIVDWGDGTQTSVEGVGSSWPNDVFLDPPLSVDKPSAYSQVGTYDIKWLGDFKNIRSISGASNKLGGNLARLEYLNDLEAINFNTNTGLVGNLNNFVNNFPLLRQLIAYTTSVELDVSTLALLDTLHSINLYRTNISFNNVAYFNNKDSFTWQFWDAGLTSNDVDNAITCFAGDGTRWVEGKTIQLGWSGLSNQGRTEASNAAVATLLQAGRNNSLQVRTYYPYTPIGAITNISASGTSHDGTHFTINAGVNSFTFSDDGVDKQAELNTTTGAWDFTNV